jgi:YD repeat-containing protein
LLITDEEGRKNVIVTDHRGLVLRSIDGENVDVTAHTSNYQYGAFNRLLQTKDNLGNATTFSFDAFGRRTGLVDPDSGPSVFTFDGYDEPVTNTDAKGQVRTFGYDDLGRMVAAGDITGSAQWIFDHGTNAIGRLSVSSNTRRTKSASCVATISRFVTS